MSRVKLLMAAALGMAMSQTALANGWSLDCGFLASWNVRTTPWQRGGCDLTESFPSQACGGLTFVPHPGNDNISGYGPHVYSDATQCTFERIDHANGALAIMIRSQNAPFPFDNGYDVAGAPNTVQETLDSVPNLHFILMDIESTDAERIRSNIHEIGRIVQANNRDEVQLGNYLWYPGAYEASAPNEFLSDRSHEHQAYMDSPLTIAIPSLYPFDNQGERHARPGCFSGVAPNLESAMFWAPLERMSTAARALPPGHLLIPFVSTYVCKLPCEAPPPTPSTLKASIQHYRLRGVHGVVLNPGKYHGDVVVTDAQYEILVYNAWHTLDQYFDESANVEFLNLSTDKLTGVEWSGINTGRHVVILTTNLGNQARPRITLPAISGIPASIAVPKGHRLRVWTLPQQTQSADFNGDNFVNSIDLAQLMAAFDLPCASCVEDLDRDHTVGTLDLVELLQQWGPVP